MDDKIVNQLVELTQALNRVRLKPLICGGLGVYFTFHGRESEIPIRTTNDIDLMLTKTQIADRAQRITIADIITDELKYTSLEGSQHFRFQKGEQRLDILAQTVEGVPIKDFRSIIIKSKLHGYHTPEADFIQEGLIEIPLSRIWSRDNRVVGLEISVPSITNQLILKLFAFNDRSEGKRKNDTQAQVHAYDVYIITTLASINDYRQGQKFLSRHSDSKIIHRVTSIIGRKFSSVEQAGWSNVLQTSTFYPKLNVRQKQNLLDQARRRLMRWFTMSS